MLRLESDTKHEINNKYRSDQVTTTTHHIYYCKASTLNIPSGQLPQTM